MEGLCKRSWQRLKLKELKFDSNYYHIMRILKISSQHCDMGPSFWLRNEASLHRIYNKDLLVGGKNVKPMQVSWLKIWDMEGCWWCYRDFFELKELRAPHGNMQNFKTMLKQSTRRKFGHTVPILDLTPHETSKRQLQSWIALSYLIYLTVQAWHHAPSTFSNNWRNILVGIRLT